MFSVRYSNFFTIPVGAGANGSYDTSSQPIDLESTLFSTQRSQSLIVMPFSKVLVWQMPLELTAVKFLRVGFHALTENLVWGSLIF